MQDEFDLIILGAGCAGLSLAMALAKAEKEGKNCPRTLILEARSSYQNDRSWCFWADPKSAFVPQHQWSTLRLSAAGKSLAIDCAQRPYQMLTAEHFYSQALAQIGAAKNITLRLDHAVAAEPQKTPRGWQVQCAATPAFAPLLVDSRSRQTPLLGGAVLWQSFYGFEVDTEQAIFNPGCVDLMDFLPAEKQQLSFVYVLPLAPTRALIELTVFGPQPLTAAQLTLQLEAQVRARCGATGFSVRRREQGILPMGLTQLAQSVAPPDASRVQVGVLAGAARPSTGYAFKRIERWAAQCAVALLDGAGPKLVAHAPDPLVTRLMDGLFLQVLKREPAAGAALFMSLFGQAQAARLIRFLSGEAGLLDCLAVIAACPTQPFLRALGSAVLRRKLV